MKDVLLELRSKVEVWMSRNEDRLLQGKVEGIAAPEWNEQFENGTAYRKRNNG